MEFPGAGTIDPLLEEIEFPAFVEVSYEPPTPTVGDVEEATEEALSRLPWDDLSPGSTIVIGLGSRGVTDVVPVARRVVRGVRERGFEPVAIPAMGSHGGASAEGQRRTLASLGLTEEVLGCSIDARMETGVVGGVPVARAALEGDALLPINRVKPHTNFEGRLESGLCKMLAVGFGKRDGARVFHERAVTNGYVPTIEHAVETLREELTVLGGVAIVENARDETALIEGIPGGELLERERELLAEAKEYMATLPYDDLDALVVERIGKDVSGTGMDTNVIGRFGVLGAEEPSVPEIERIAVLGLTEATHGNGHGIGLADVTTVEVLESLALDEMYANALTSGSLSRSCLPLALPSDEHAVVAALTSAGPYDPEAARVAWIRDTGHLSGFYASEALAEERIDGLSIGEPIDLSFPDGSASLS
jgi:hypothetical protein